MKRNYIYNDCNNNINDEIYMIDETIIIDCGCMIF